MGGKQVTTATSYLIICIYMSYQRVAWSIVLTLMLFLQ